MRPVDARSAFAAKLAQPIEQLMRFARRQRRRWFVENQNFGVEGECANNLDNLLKSDTELSDRLRRIDLIPESEAREFGPCHRFEPCIIDQAKAPWFTAEQQVLCDGKFRHQH